jgi:hypothetical protein
MGQVKTGQRKDVYSLKKNDKKEEKKKMRIEMKD